MVLIEQGFVGTRLRKLGRRMPCGECNEVTIQKYDISATRIEAAPTEGRAFLATLCACDSNHDYPFRMGLPAWR